MGITVLATSGGWLTRTGFGNPAPSILFFAAAGGAATGQVEVLAGGSAFSFVSVDLYSSMSNIPYVFTADGQYQTPSPVLFCRLSSGRTRPCRLPLVRPHEISGRPGRARRQVDALAELFRVVLAERRSRVTRAGH